MSATIPAAERDLEQQLADAKAIIEALLAGQVDAVFDVKSQTPLLVAKAQDALRASEARYRGIVETSNEGIWTVDIDARLTFVNRRLTEMLGYSGQQMLGRRLFEFLPESARPKSELRIERARQGLSDESEVEIRRGDGSILWGLVRTTPILDGDGKVTGVLGMLTDKSGTRDAEVALRKSEDQYRQIVEATSDGIFKLDDAGHIVFVNRRLSEMLGYTSEELIAQGLIGFMSPETIGNAKQQLKSSFATIDASLRHKNGTEISVNIAGTELLDGAGGPPGHLGVVRDVTERKKLHAQLMVSDRMASVGTLAAGVAHEINNPLAAVIANLDYIAESLARVISGDGAWSGRGRNEAWLAEEVKGPLDDAREAATRVRFIVRDLKIFSRSEAEEIKAPVDVQAIMESSLRMAWNEIRHRARLVKLYGRVPAVAANEARLGQVFLNLVVNAAQAMQEGRAEHNEIRVITRLEGERVVIEVNDNGPGISPAIIGRIFDPFFTTKAVGQGTGLGLAICQRIVTDLGGELTVQSEQGKGTSFLVSLAVAGTCHSDAAPVKPTEIAGRRGRILIVDDEEVVLRSVTRILARDHEVVATVVASEALARCAGGERFDLILCDLMMPEMTGMDFHRELVRVAPEQATRTIFLTGGAFTAAARAFLSQTALEHIEKPFDSVNLRAIVQRYL